MQSTLNICSLLSSYTFQLLQLPLEFHAWANESDQFLQRVFL